MLDRLVTSKILNGDQPLASKKAMAGMAPVVSPRMVSQLDLQELKRRLPGVPDSVISHFLATVRRARAELAR